MTRCFCLENKINQMRLCLDLVRTITRETLVMIEESFPSNQEFRLVILVSQNAGKTYQDPECTLIVLKLIKKADTLFQTTCKFNSKLNAYRNSKAAHFSPTQRFKPTKVEDRPGPGYYDMPGEVNKNNGFQLISNFHTVKTRRFGTSVRSQQESKNNTPGPGTYRAPSDFGYLDFKHKAGYTPSSSRGKPTGSLTNSHRRQLS